MDFQPTLKADNKRNLLDFLIQFHAAVTCRNNLGFYKNPLPMFCQILEGTKLYIETINSMLFYYI